VSSVSQPPAPAPLPLTFDEAYFDRFYENPKTRVHSRKEVRLLARAICSLARFWGIAVETVLDVGAGPGHWRKAIAKECQHATYRSIDVSPVACTRYGHELKNISSFQEDTEFDLIICQGVLQYLAHQEVVQAIANMAAMSAGLLYVEVLTQRDTEQVIDVSKSDLNVYIRTGNYYRKELGKHFVSLGCGLFFSKQKWAPFYELELGSEEHILAPDLNPSDSAL
jgi:predicted TPR repeat methyltransferase